MAILKAWIEDVKVDVALEGEKLGNGTWKSSGLPRPFLPAETPNRSNAQELQMNNIEAKHLRTAPHRILNYN
jgi:hypothetical protein